MMRIFSFKKIKITLFFRYRLFSNRIPILNLEEKHLGYKTQLSNTKFKFFVSDGSQRMRYTPIIITSKKI